MDVQAVLFIAVSVAIVNYVVQVCASHSDADPPSTRTMMWHAFLSAISTAIALFVIGTSKQYIPSYVLDLGGTLGLVEAVDSAVPVFVDRF